MIRTISLAAITALMVLPTTAHATHGSGDGPRHDFTVGGGISGINTHFGFAAQSRPNGTDFGYAVFKNQTVGTETAGHVVCVRTVGNRASFVFEVEQGMFGMPFRAIAVEDNGEPVDGQPVDRLRGFGGFATRPTECPNPQNAMFTAANVLTEGNILVHDSPADA